MHSKPIPTTTGKLKERIEDMAIGDYIKVDYLRSSLDSVINSTSSAECPINGTTSGTAPQCFFYLIKVEKGLLTSDRVVGVGATWDELNTGKHVQGRPATLYGVSGIIRSLTGGVAYADENGNKSGNTNNFVGCFPSNNEYDKYITRFPVDKIQVGNTIDDVFHCKDIWSWTQNTPDIAVSASSTRIARRHVNGNDPRFSPSSSNTSNTSTGFRPVFEYQET